MEIFQTIWNVLTTESEMTTYVINMPLMFVEAYVYTLCFTLLLDISHTKLQKNLYVLSISVLSILSMLIIPSPYYTFINMLLLPLLIFIIFKTTIIKAIFSEIIIYILAFVINSILMIITTGILNIPSSVIELVPINRMIFCIINYSAFYLFYKLCKKYNIKITFLDKLQTKKNNVIFNNLIVGTIAIAVQLYIEFTYIDYIPTHLVILSMSILLTYFIISLYSLFRTSKLETTTEKLEEEQLHNKTLTILYDNIRGFKHDFNNIVQGIGGYITTDNIEGLKEYYSQVLDDCQRVNNLTILTPEIINNPPIYSLLTSKYHKATELGIKVNLEIFMDLSNINIKIYEFTRILGILLLKLLKFRKKRK